MSIHEGHRQRLKERFCKEGLENFDDLYVIELLLYYCITRKDTNKIAHDLLNKFGSLQRVLEAEKNELMQIDGVGEHAAVFLKLIREVGRYYQVQSSRVGQVLSSIDQCGKFMQPYFYGRERETVFLLCLDAKCKALCCTKVEEGSVNSASISIRKVVEAALSANASSVILGHNHPSGLALPSGEDIETTKRLSKALQLVDITLVDHLIFAEDDFVSVAQSGRYSPFETCKLLEEEFI